MSEPLPTLFDGITINDKRDNPRLTAQLAEVKRFMLVNGKGYWWTLKQISRLTGYPEASVSARLRDLRKAKFGAFNVERKYVSRGIWAYRVTR